MNSVAANRSIPYTHFEQLREGRSIIRQEAEALMELANRVDLEFCAAVETLQQCAGSVVVTGMGKAGLIGKKIAATLSSTGTRSHFLHPAEAVHGDLGCLHTNDVLLALSNSGETEEICRLLPIVRRMQIPVVALTASQSSTLGSQANVTVELGNLKEAGAFGLAPSTSTTAMLAVGDALALVVSRVNGFTPQQFAVFHPGGSLGRRLTTVRAIMRQADQLRLTTGTATIREVLVGQNRPGRRSGAVIVVDGEGRLIGLFTDSDLARLLEQRRDETLDRPIADVMTAHPQTVDEDATLNDVVEILSNRKFSELPVIDADTRPVGLVDITDVIGLMPHEQTD